MYFLWNRKIINIVLKTEQRLLQTHNGRDGHHMITTKTDYENSTKGSAFLSRSLIVLVSTFSIILSLKSLLSLVKLEKSSKDG